MISRGWSQYARPFSAKENELWNAQSSTSHWVRGERYQHFGARYYDPVSCCWTGQDPLAESYYNISPYAYCAGDPVNRVDPEGERVRIWFYDNTGVRRSILYSGESITHSNAFVNSVIKAYQYNKTNWIKVGYIEDSPQHVW